MLAFRGIERTTPAFRRALSDVADRLETDVSFLGAVMSRESGFRAEVVNPQGGATGLIQFMPSTARRLGTTTEALRGMSAEDQLPFVEAYYHPFTGRIHSATDAYMATFLPAFVGKPLDFVLAASADSGVEGAQPSIVYDQNRGFDVAGKGFITVGDVGAAAENAIADAQTRPLTDDREPGDPVGNTIVVGSVVGLFYLALRWLKGRKG